MKMKELHLGVVLLAAETMFRTSLEINVDQILDSRVEDIVSKVDTWWFRTIPLAPSFFVCEAELVVHDVGSWLGDGGRLVVKIVLTRLFKS
jgi:hypothetical protein